MHIDLAQVLNVLNVALGAIAFFAAHGFLKNRYFRVVSEAIAVAEKTIDHAAYDSAGHLNQARLAVALMVIAKVFPKVNKAKAIADIEAVLAVIHQHANDLPPAAIVPVVTPAAGPIVPPPAP